jgi:4-hydroxybenzoate polyprenyltransferase
MTNKIKYILFSMRPQQWVKNVFLFAGVLFSRSFFDLALVVKVFEGFVLFCMAASSIYILNDVMDAEKDRFHPEKRHRPLAANLLNAQTALTAALVLAALCVAGAFALDPPFGFILISYLGLNLAYSLKIKTIVILDVMCIAAGFVLRILAGTTLAGVVPSDWLILCTITLSLFLGFSKRRYEIALIGDNAESHRKVLTQYSLPFLDQMIAVATASTVMSYALYTVSAETISRFGTRNLVFTIPFVLYGIYRYLYLMHEQKAGGNPTKTVLQDWPLIINGLAWAAVSFFIIYKFV